MCKTDKKLNCLSENDKEEFFHCFASFKFRNPIADFRLDLSFHALTWLGPFLLIKNGFSGDSTL